MSSSMLSVEVSDFPQVEADLRVASAGFSRAVGTTLARAASPTADMVRASASAAGLRKAALAVRTSNSTRGVNSVVEVYVTRDVAPYAADAVKFRHPVFGTSTWVDQSAEHEFFDQAISRASGAVEAAIGQAMPDMLHPL